MRNGLHIGRLFGINIYLDWSWLLIFLLVTWSLATQFAQMHPVWGLGLAWGVAIVAALLFFTSVLAHLRIDAQGFAWIPQEDYVNHFAADVDPDKANVMYAVQQPAHVGVLAETMGTPAWKTLPSWYLVATNDEAIPPDAQRFFAQRMRATTVELESSHVPMVSHPGAVAKLIKQAARAVGGGD